MRAVLGSSVVTAIVFSFLFGRGWLRVRFDIWLRISDALEQLEISRKLLLLGGRELCLDGVEQPILLRCTTGLDHFPASMCERQDGLPSVGRVWRALDQASSLKRRNRRTHRLLSHPFSPCERAHSGRAIAFQTNDHGRL